MCCASAGEWLTRFDWINPAFVSLMDCNIWGFDHIYLQLVHRVYRSVESAVTVPVSCGCVERNCRVRGIYTRLAITVKLLCPQDGQAAGGGIHDYIYIICNDNRWNFLSWLLTSRLFHLQASQSNSRHSNFKFISSPVENINSRSRVKFQPCDFRYCATAWAYHLR